MYSPLISSSTLPFPNSKAVRSKNTPNMFPIILSIFSCPYGCSSSAGLLLKYIPNKIPKELPTSDREFIPSDTKALEFPYIPPRIFITARKIF